MELNEEIAECSVCHQRFEREIDRPEGKLVSCPKHSFGEVEETENEKWERWAQENNICRICSQERTICGGEEKHG